MSSSSIRLRDIRRLDRLSQAIAVVALLNFAFAGVEFAVSETWVDAAIGVLNLLAALWMTSILNDELEAVDETTPASGGGESGSEEYLTDGGGRSRIECSRCGGRSTIESKARAEVLEGPNRGVKKTVNLVQCESCGALLAAQKPIPGVSA